MFLSLVVLLFCSCSSGVQTNSNRLDENASSEKGDKKKKHDKDKDETKSDTNANSATPPGDCNKDLWTRVYNPERLEVKDQCKVVTGTIAERNADEDGDEHMLLKLDDGQDDLLSKENKKKKDGDLVIEAVCVNKATLKKVGSTCDGYSNPIQLPNVGDHVRVTGSYVNDSHNGWMEIHPISKVEKLN